MQTTTTEAKYYFSYKSMPKPRQSERNQRNITPKYFSKLKTYPADLCILITKSYGGLHPQPLLNTASDYCVKTSITQRNKKENNVSQCVQSKRR